MVFEVDASSVEAPQDAQSFSAGLNTNQRSALKDMLLQLSQRDNTQVDEGVCLRFLAHQNYNADKAFEQYIKYLEWRQTENIDEIDSVHIEQDALIQATIPFSLCSFTKSGSPLYIEKTGLVHAFAVPHIKRENFIKFHIRGMEKMLRMMHESADRLGKPVNKVCSIIDLAGLSWQHKDALSILKAATQLDEMYYPGLVGTVFIINAPWFVRGLYEVAKQFLPVSTVNQVRFLGSDFKQVLLSEIDADQLPVEYGGSMDSDESKIQVLSKQQVEELVASS